MEKYGPNMVSILNDKFQMGESVISLLKTRTQMNSVSLLILVNLNDTNAIFAFCPTQWPPISSSNLILTEIFEMDTSFKFEKDVGSSFTIAAGNGNFTYLYSPENEVHFFEFENIVQQIKTVVLSTETDFSHWLSYYRHDGSDYSSERDKKFRKELARREPQYTVNKTFSIYVATWNVNDQTPYDVMLNEWLSVGDEPPDIYAIAFQELDMSTKAISLNETRPDANWVKKVMAGLHPGATYCELTTVRLVGMMLIIAVKESIRKTDIKFFNYQKVGTGALNIMGNKGGVGVSLMINRTRICFVNSHLAAHTGEVEQRKIDHDEILKRMIFQHGIKRFTINEHHLVFWFGDLNYRLDDLTSDHIKFLIDQQKYNELILVDQLYKQKMRNAVFQGYSEGSLTFPPTYKYNPGTDEFDSSEKARAPAWCDRVLWRGNAIQRDYNCVMQMRMSDHKPVYSIFTTQVEIIDEEKRKKIYEETLKSLDKYENDNQPQISVSNTDIDFDVIQFNQSYHRELVVSNYHHLPVDFNFRVKDRKFSDQTIDGTNDRIATTRVCENWLNLSHTKGQLQNGQSLTIGLDIMIDCKSAQELMKKFKAGQKILLDILVLHVKNGRDTFISIIGDYKPSCFGLSMAQLALLERPIVEYVDYNDVLRSEAARGSNTIKVPRELYHLIHYLYGNGLKTSQLFTLDRQFAKNPIVNEIRDWIDEWSTEEFPGTPHTAAEALLMLLESAPETLLHAKEKELIENITRPNICLGLLQQIDIIPRSIFFYIILFLRELAKYYPFNRLNDEIVAQIFSKIFFKSYATNRTKTTIFVKHAINNFSLGEYVRSQFF